MKLRKMQNKIIPSRIQQLAWSINMAIDLSPEEYKNNLQNIRRQYRDLFLYAAHCYDQQPPHFNMFKKDLLKELNSKNKNYEIVLNDFINMWTTWVDTHTHEKRNDMNV